MDELTTLESRLQGLASFLPIFEDPDFTFGTWEGGQKDASGAIQMPYFVRGDAADSFFRAANSLGWIDPKFRWPEWSETTECQELRNSHEAMARATPDQLSHLLTALLRADRFSEGVLDEAYESGLLTRILRRAASLLAELAPPD
jgi:hypothetical protein